MLSVLAVKAALWMVQSVRPSVRPSHLSHYVPITWHYYHWQKHCPRERSRSDIKGQGHRVKTQVTSFRTVSPVCHYICLINGNEMMHKAWCGTGEMACFFSRSSVIFQVHTDKKSPIWSRTGRFRTVTLVWIHKWLWNDARSLKWHRRNVLSSFMVICQSSRSHATTNRQFSPELRISAL